MFNCISPRYDLLNRWLSLGVDRRWRARLARQALGSSPARVLDVATGTGDVAIAMATGSPAVRVWGVDISEGMLGAARTKIARRQLTHRITLGRAMAEALPFPDQHFDVVTVAFGVRNFARPLAGLQEVARVLRPGGELLVLEFASPRPWWLRWLFGFYFHKVLPRVGRLVSGHRTAYAYLPLSVAHFPEGEQFLDLLRQAGFSGTTCTPLTGGIASLYRGRVGASTG